MTEVIVCWFSIRFLIHTFALWIDYYLSIRNHMTISIYVAVMRIIMMPSCPYFILSTPLPLNMWTYLSLSASAWGQGRSKLGGVHTFILHHAFISIFIALWAVISHYVTILMAILSYFTRYFVEFQDFWSCAE